MSTYGYIRVSGLEQVDNTSLDEQRRKIDGASLILGQPVDEVFADGGVSGTIPLAERPEGRRLAEKLTKGDTVIAAKLDRLFRDAADALGMAKAWKERGVQLILVDMGPDPVTENGTAKFLFTILAAVAEMERERIAERTADGRRAKRAKGGHVGGSAPFGYRKVGAGKEAMLVPDPDQQDAIRTIHAARASGMSLRDIAELVGYKHSLSVSYEAVRRIVNVGEAP